jgi:hypothetical protein
MPLYQHMYMAVCGTYPHLALKLAIVVKAATIR